jgi:hypothetical protein
MTTGRGTPRSPAHARNTHRRTYRQQSEHQVKVTDVTPRFKLTFYAVVAITIMCLMFYLVAVILKVAPADAENFADGFKVGLGTLVGLIGGKAA